MSSAATLYDKYLEDADFRNRTKAAYLIALESYLATLGINIFWPEPPFDQDFNSTLLSNIDYQIHWSLQISELISKMTPSESSLLNRPTAPYTAEAITDFVASHQQVIEQRRFWEGWFSGQRRTEEEEQIFNLQKSWNKEGYPKFQAQWESRFQKAEEWMMLTEKVLRGVFNMGATEGFGRPSGSEVPCHEVTISRDIAMMKHLVTQELYESVVGINPSQFKGARHPVENVNWYEAVAFANQLSELHGLEPAYQIDGKSVHCDFDAAGWRLPTEAEWEYCARGGEIQVCAGGNDVDAVAWYAGNSGNGTHPVGQKAVNGFGLSDMNGNVWEWCWDWYGAYQSASVMDPKGPSLGTFRVLRGGSWVSLLKDIRVSGRGNYDPSIRNHILGFRLVRLFS